MCLINKKGIRYEHNQQYFMSATATKESCVF